MFGKNDTCDAEAYKKARKKRIIAFFVVLVSMVIAAILSLEVNQYGMSLGEIFNVISIHINGNVPLRSEDYTGYIKDLMVFDMYIPRAIGCVTIGAILATGGAVMQSIIRNPLADSYTTGISSGALLGVCLFIFYGISFFSLDGEFGKITNAFICSMIPCSLILFFSMFRKTTASMIVLVGIAVSFFISAIITFMNYVASPDQLEEVYEWSIGTLNMIEPISSYYLIPTAIVMVILMTYFGNLINITAMNDNLGMTLGVKSIRVRIISLVLVSLFTTMAVCFVGTIGFIGLVIPHVARMFVGSNCRILIPTSALLGAIILLGADCLARLLMPGGMPVGLITSMIGGPVMLFLLLRMRKDAWSN